MPSGSQAGSTHLRNLDIPWEAHLDEWLVAETLEKLVPEYRAALTLRYLDGLPVPEVARILERSVSATESVLVRARAAFRRMYEGEEGPR